MVLFDRVSTKLRHEYKRDDVVALQYVQTPFRLVSPHFSLTLSRFISSPINPRLMLVKRIIAVPGDTVRAAHDDHMGIFEFSPMTTG